MSKPIREVRKIERPRVLHRSPWAGKSDYTSDLSKGARGEPEPYDAATLQEIHDRAEDQFGVYRAMEREAVPLSVRVTALEAAALSGDQRARRQLFVIRQRLESFESGQGRKRAA